MKVQLFILIMFFLASNVFGQNNNNSNYLNKAEQEKGINTESKALKKESVISIEESLSPAILVAPIPESSGTNDNNETGKLDIISTKDQQSAYSIKKAKFELKQTEFNQQRMQRTYGVQQEKELEGLCREVAAESPASFESLLFYYETGQYDLTRASALLKAYEMNPSNLDAQKQMLIYYFLTDKNEEVRTALLKIFKNKVYPDAIENYGIDVLKSVPLNGILVTHGTEDSFGALYAERVLRKREDVTVVCLDWLNSPQWRTKLKAQGIKLPTTDFIGVKYLEEFCHLNQNSNVALSLTIPKEYFLPILSNLYISGLVFEYKEIATDNSLQNEILWETTLEKKLLETKDHDLVLNYIPMMAQMSRYYESQKQMVEKIEMDNEINEVAKSRGKKLK